MTVNYATGELVPVNPAELQQLNGSMREVAVSTYLEYAKTWLATAVETTGPEQIAMARAEIATAAEATKQLHLSKEIQLDAQEMVRRAEYALGKAIRKGQAEGTVRSKGNGGGTPNGAPRGDNTMCSPYDFASHSELHGQGDQGNGILGLASAAPDEFGAALDEAKEEGNVSRANVVRKIKRQAQATLSRQQRADLIEDLAAQGYSSRQMPKKVGVSEETIRQIARDFDIEIPADKIVGRSRRLDHTQILESTVYGLEDTVSAIRLIDYSEVDPAKANEWATSLTDSISELRRFLKQIKEMTHV